MPVASFHSCHKGAGNASPAETPSRSEETASVPFPAMALSMARYPVGVLKNTVGSNRAMVSRTLAVSRGEPENNTVEPPTYQGKMRLPPRP